MNHDAIIIDGSYECMNEKGEIKLNWNKRVKKEELDRKGCHNNNFVCVISEYIILTPFHCLYSSLYITIQ